MLKRIKKLSISSICIILILVIFGGIALVRTIRKDVYQIKDSEDGVSAAVKSSVVSFAADYEQLIPHERRMNTLLYYATGIFNSNHVIWGKDDWLFYSSTNSGDPIADYTGANSYSDDDLELAKNNMLSVQIFLKEKGIEFCLLVPPNKENVYSQYMPDKYYHTDKTRTDILMEYLYKNGVNAVNPKKALLTCEEPYRTYFKQDTHWNELGAYIGTRETLKTFDIELQDLADVIIEDGTYSISDLADMVGLKSVFPDDYGFRINTKNCSDEILEEEIETVTHIHNNNAPIKKNLLLIGDSFRGAMCPTLEEEFEDLYLIHRNDYNFEVLDRTNPDYVVLEYVERHSAQILDFSIE